MKRHNPTKNKKSSKPAASIQNPAISVWLTPALLLIVTGLVFSPALWNQFVNWDDYENLVDNPNYRGLGLSQLRWLFTTFHMGHYQPLSWLTLGLDYQIWGLDPFGYHLTNLALHAANAVLFYFLSRKFFSLAFTIPDKEGGWTLDLNATFAALLFAIHPLRVESVVWATERRDVLSGFFYFLTIGCYLKAATASEWHNRCQWFWAAVVGYGLSLLSKATAMTLPAVLVLLDIYPLRRLRWPVAAWFKPPLLFLWREKIPFLLLAAVFAVTALLAQQSIGALKPLQQYSIGSRIAQAFYGVNFYFWKTLLPVRLSPIYELPFDPRSWTWIFVLCATSTVIITVGLYLLKQRWPALLACWAYYLILLAPVSGIAQSGPQFVADRYSYLAGLSWSLLAGAGWYRFHRSSNRSRPSTRDLLKVTLLPAVILAGLGALTWQQALVWRDTKTLWLRAIAVTPNSSLAHYNLGRTFESEGRSEQALELYRTAIRLNPGYADAHHNLARLLARMGHQEEAIAQYRQALAVKPDDADTHNNLGLLLAVQGDPNGAVAELRQAIKIDPKHARAYFNMARIFALQDKLEDAKRNYREAEKLQPDELEIQLGLGNVLARQGDLEGASVHFARAVRLKPDFANAHMALAKLLEAQGKKDEAERHYNEAVRLLKMQTNHAPPSG